MTRLGRYSVSASLVAALLALPCVCQAYESPTEFCHDVAESAYQVAVAQGDALPDGCYEQAQADCEAAAWRAHLAASPEFSLNELVAFDQDGDWWLLGGARSDSDRELDMQDARDFLMRCPDAETGTEVCQ